MRAIPQILSAFYIVLVFSGCSGLITTVTPTGVGSIGGTSLPPPKQTSEALYLPMNFSIRPKKQEELKTHAGSITEQQARDFLSIGIRHISQDLGFDTAAWKLTIHQDTDPFPEIGPPISDLPNVTTLKYKAFAKITSPGSRTLAVNTATRTQKSLLAIDRSRDDNFIYRSSLNGTISASVRQEVPDRVFFDVDLWLKLRRKSHYAPAADRYYRSFEPIDETALARFIGDFQNGILEAYARLFKSLGITVEQEPY